jgi:Tol biopolymer transport system component
MRPDGSGLTNLTNDPAHDVDPYWSPDGKRIAFLSDRAGYMQVFVMNADGSNVFQVTTREAEHAFQGLLRSGFSPWSPDGTTLAFLKRTPEGGQLIYTMQASGRNGLPLINQPGEYSSISWSRDGRRIAYIALSENETPQLHVIDADGDNDTIITDALPDGEELYEWKYTWTPNGQSILFTASNLPAQGGFSLESSAANPYYWKIYEASLDGRTLIQRAEARSPIGGWWQGNYFVTPLIGVQGWTWVTAEGTTSLNPFRNCADSSGGGYLHRQSSNGNTFLAARCPDFDWWLYWVNPKGTMLPLIDSPLTAPQGDLYNPVWSPDDRYIAFNVVESGVTNQYILDVTQAVGSTPVTVPIGGGDLFHNISWQPMP